MEAALSIHLDNFSKTLGSREQLAIAEFADALLVIPKTLAVNAGKVDAGPTPGPLPRLTSGLMRPGLTPRRSPNMPLRW